LMIPAEGFIDRLCRIAVYCNACRATIQRGRNKMQDVALIRCAGRKVWLRGAVVFVFAKIPFSAAAAGQKKAGDGPVVFLADAPEAAKKYPEGMWYNGWDINIIRRGTG